ncbi:MAG: Gfo/Idh/MocA family oxidoreductase [Phycisphaerae bacterium]|nr:Gfo/Idh/MocA family oxidoreductase [Phycisphaerae bacterium]
MYDSSTRRSFLQAMGVGAASLGLQGSARSEEKPIPGFAAAPADADSTQGWKPFSDRKIRVGIVGYGVCKFGAAFSFQDHPNVRVVAVSDLMPERCAQLAKACRCEKTYPSLEELVKDKAVEAVFVAADGRSHGSRRGVRHRVS